MIGQELIIVFKKDKAFLTPYKALNFEQIGLYGEKTFKTEAFWKIKILKFNESENKIMAEILAYHVGAESYPNNQLHLADKLIDIEKVVFQGGIDTHGLLKTLNSTTPLKIIPQKSPNVIRRDPFEYQSNQNFNISINHTIQEVFSVPF
jgi:hypothetical protein